MIYLEQWQKNRFKNELLWGVHKILELYKNGIEYNVVFDYVCDIEIHLTEDKFEFYQIKTHNSWRRLHFSDK